MTKTKHDWSALDALNDEARLAATMSDPDNQPPTDKDIARIKLVPRMQVMTQEEFDARFHIPVGTLRAWEQGRTEPDQPARAYLRVIARDPEHVRAALGPLA